jgi:glutamate receptor, ionotropic, plant
MSLAMVAGRARLSLLLLFFTGLGSILPLPTSRGQPAPASATKETVTVGLIIDADSPVGRIANTTIPMALDDFYATYPNSSARVQVLTHDSRGDVVAAASAGMDVVCLCRLIAFL